LIAGLAWPLQPRPSFWSQVLDSPYSTHPSTLLGGMNFCHHGGCLRRRFWKIGSSVYFSFARVCSVAVSFFSSNNRFFRLRFANGARIMSLMALLRTLLLRLIRFRLSMWSVDHLSGRIVPSVRCFSSRTQVRNTGQCADSIPSARLRRPPWFSLSCSLRSIPMMFDYQFFAAAHWILNSFVRWGVDPGLLTRVFRL